MGLMMGSVIPPKVPRFVDARTIRPLDVVAYMNPEGKLTLGAVAASGWRTVVLEATPNRDRVIIPVDTIREHFRGGLLGSKTH